MRGNVPAYTLEKPKSLAAALERMAAEPKAWRAFAGGTDLMVSLETGALSHHKFLDISACSELKGIRRSGEELHIGALTTFAQIQESAEVRRDFGMLHEAAASVGAIAIQNRATIGGNIANASPAADSLPALLAYNARVELVSSGGTRWVPYREFHKGYKKTALEPHELIQTIALPLSPRADYAQFRKVGTRAAQAISKICFAGWLKIENHKVLESRLAFGSMGPTPIRCAAIERSLAGKSLDRKVITDAKSALSGELQPIDDIRSTAEYRLRVSMNLLEDFLLSAQRAK